jgi:hypothetical protein
LDTKRFALLNDILGVDFEHLAIWYLRRR